MDLETATKIMGEACQKHCTSLESLDFAMQSELTRYLSGWTYDQLRTYAAELIRVLDEYDLSCEVEKVMDHLAGGSDGPNTTI